MSEISINPAHMGLPEKALSTLCEQLKKYIPLEWIVESVIADLKESDKGYFKGTCPLCHKSKFTVSSKHNLYYCFDCNESGDVIAFIAHIKGISQVEALSYLYQLYGTTIMNAIERKIEVPE